MRRGNLFPFVLVGLMAIGLVAISMSYLLGWFSSITERSPSIILGIYSSFLFIFLIIVLLVNGNNQRQQAVLEETQQEIERQLRLIDRNRRGSQKQRKTLVVDTFAFVEELNQFISVTTYQRTKRGLLEAQQEFNELKVLNPMKYRQSGKRKNGATVNFLQTEAGLTELGLRKLATMKIIGASDESSDQTGKEQFLFLLDEKVSFFEQEYQGLSPYFGAITTLMVYLNKQAKKGHLSREQYEHQIECLRHHFTRNDLLILLLYVLLIPSGCQLAVELVGTSFFGDLAEVGQNTFFEAPELFRIYLEEVFARSASRSKNRDKQDMTRYFYQVHRQGLAKSYRNRKTAVNRVLSGEYYVKNENGQPFLRLVDRLSLD
ncbi:tetraspanin family protein [Vagococcus sp. BWB3-3]|uniref:Tetraspanin family protein n=1 Tax=Vagococcus allomyrinae TaxID=2794353 RepID=A0A940PH59_9ENTE|nr:tetraspanin family protein [Vagococcus allomyrinae]MBP1043863.1 tetraspanin family protein [Vagococcus allomyrinae]